MVLFTMNAACSLLRERIVMYASCARYTQFSCTLNRRGVRNEPLKVVFAFHTGHKCIVYLKDYIHNIQRIDIIYIYIYIRYVAQGGLYCFDGAFEYKKSLLARVRCCLKDGWRTGLRRTTITDKRDDYK